MQEVDSEKGTNFEIILDIVQEDTDTQEKKNNKLIYNSSLGMRLDYGTIRYEDFSTYSKLLLNSLKYIKKANDKTMKTVSKPLEGAVKFKNQDRILVEKNLSLENNIPFILFCRIKKFVQPFGVLNLYEVDTGVNLKNPLNFNLCKNSLSFFVLVDREKAISIGSAYSFKCFLSFLYPFKIIFAAIESFIEKSDTIRCINENNEFVIDDTSKIIASLYSFNTLKKATFKELKKASGTYNDGNDDYDEKLVEQMLSENFSF